jgi:mannan endo-1,4-beta-mannosidase
MGEPRSRRRCVIAISLAILSLLTVTPAAATTATPAPSTDPSLTWRLPQVDLGGGGGRATGRTVSVGPEGVRARANVAVAQDPFTDVWRRATRMILLFVPVLELGCSRAMQSLPPDPPARPLIQIVCDEIPSYVRESSREPVDVEASMRSVERALPSAESAPSEGAPNSTPTGGRRVAQGVYVNDFVWTNASLDRFEQQVGQPMQIVQWYQPWGADRSVGDYRPELDVEALHRTAARGATPMITWEAWGRINGVEPTPVRTITTGAFDSYIDSWAVGLRDFGKPVYLRLFHEMNLDRYPWSYGINGNSAEDLIASWRYVHDRFKAAGADKVVWVWSPNVEDSRVSFRRIYPGTEYVDWFGIDGYNRGRHWWYSTWRSPRQLFQRSLDAIGALDPEKPIVIAEVSCVEEGGNKAQWVRELYAALPAENPRLRAIVWFDYDMSADPNETDWHLATSEETLAAYVSATSSALYARREGSANR